MKYKYPLRKNQKGAVLLALIIMMPFLMLVVASYLQLTVNNYYVSREDQYNTNAQFAADAGLDLAIQEIKAASGWSGTAGTDVTLSSDGTTRTAYKVTVAPIDANTKSVTSIGRIYSPVSVLKSEITIQIILKSGGGGGGGGAGTHGLVAGPGGLYMDNNSTVPSGKDISINGKLVIKDASKLGLPGNTNNIEISHQSCSSTYPRVCAVGEDGEPIAVSGGATINGVVKANNQTTTAGINSLVAGSGVIPKPMPTYDRNAQKTAVIPANALTGASASCNGGTKIWGPNAKITGNVTVKNTCEVTIKGNVWITGDLNVSNNAKLIVDNPLLAVKPVIMVDGSTTAIEDNSKLVSNLSGTGMMIINFWSPIVACSPDCVNLTGTDLLNSQSQRTILLKNLAVGPQSILYAYWTKLELDNAGSVGAIAAQNISLKDTGAPGFGTTINSTGPILGGGGGASTWSVASYKRVY